MNGQALGVPQAPDPTGGIRIVPGAVPPVAAIPANGKTAYVPLGMMMIAPHPSGAIGRAMIGTAAGIHYEVRGDPDAIALALFGFPQLTDTPR